jgi:hypothetical protein
MLVTGIPESVTIGQQGKQLTVDSLQMRDLFAQLRTDDNTVKGTTV